jgi:trans-2,3-dihydro-3-hydroxyanthranilate isomerase
MNDVRSADVTPGAGLKFKLSGVFGSRPFGGAPLPVVFSPGTLDAPSLLRITQEFGQFETVFLTPTNEPGRWHARIFDLIEELPFAGAPLLGAAAAVVDAEQSAGPTRVELVLGARSVAVEVTRGDGVYVARLDAGRPDLVYLEPDRVGELLSRFHLSHHDMLPSLRPAMVNTGLRYVVLPVTSQALASAAITGDIGDLLRREGAQFAVLFDAVEREIRHWSNDGKIEDIATGSAASVVGAYMVASGVASAGAVIVLKQGRFRDRPSVLMVHAEVEGGVVSRVHLSGRVHFIGEGRLQVLP